MEVDGQEKKRLIPGDSFGESALLNNDPRTAAVRGIKNGTHDILLWAVSPKAYAKHRKLFLEKVKKSTLKLMDNIPLFSKQFQT